MLILAPPKFAQIDSPSRAKGSAGVRHKPLKINDVQINIGNTLHRVLATSATVQVGRVVN